MSEDSHIDVLLLSTKQTTTCEKCARKAGGQEQPPGSGRSAHCPVVSGILHALQQDENPRGRPTTQGVVRHAVLKQRADKQYPVCKTLQHHLWVTAVRSGDQIRVVLG